MPTLQTSFVLLMSIISFAACSHMHVERATRTQMEICGNRWANAKKMLEHAQEQGCSNATPIGSRVLRDGSAAFQINRSGSGTVQTTAQQCVIFACGAQESYSLPAPSAWGGTGQ